MKLSEIQNSDQSKVIAFFKKAWNQKIFRVLAGGLLGAGAGWLYWEFIGCNGGSCPLTSNATQTVIIFSLFGMWFNYRK